MYIDWGYRIIVVGHMVKCEGQCKRCGMYGLGHINKHTCKRVRVQYVKNTGISVRDTGCRGLWYMI